VEANGRYLAQLVVLFHDEMVAQLYGERVESTSVVRLLLAASMR